MSVESKTGIEASDAAALAAATKKRARIGTLLSLTLLGLLALMWVALAFSTTSFWTSNNISQPAAARFDDGNPRDRRDVRHHHRRYRSVGRRGRRVRQRHHRLAVDA